MCAAFNGKSGTTVVSCHWWNGRHQLLRWAIFPCPIYSQTPRSNRRWRLECSYTKKKKKKKKMEINSTYTTRRIETEFLADFSLENRLDGQNKMSKREGKLCSYTYLNNSKSHLDYIFINKKWINSNLNCEGVLSDHRIVTKKIRLNLRRNKTQTIKA